MEVSCERRLRVCVKYMCLSVHSHSINSVTVCVCVRERESLCENVHPPQHSSLFTCHLVLQFHLSY